MFDSAVAKVKNVLRRKQQKTESPKVEAEHVPFKVLLIGPKGSGKSTFARAARMRWDNKTGDGQNLGNTVFSPGEIKEFKYQILSQSLATLKSYLGRECRDRGLPRDIREPGEVILGADAEASQDGLPPAVVDAAETVWGNAEVKQRLLDSLGKNTSEAQSAEYFLNHISQLNSAQETLEKEAILRVYAAPGAQITTPLVVDEKKLLLQELTYLDDGSAPWKAIEPDAIILTVPMAQYDDDWQDEQGIHPSTVTRCRATLDEVYKWLAEEGKSRVTVILCFMQLDIFKAKTGTESFVTHFPTCVDEERPFNAAAKEILEAFSSTKNDTHPLYPQFVCGVDPTQAWLVWASITEIMFPRPIYFVECFGSTGLSNTNS